MAPLLDSTRDFRNQPLSLPDSPKKSAEEGTHPPGKASTTLTMTRPLRAGAGAPNSVPANQEGTPWGKRDLSQWLTQCTTLREHEGTKHGRLS